MPGARAVAAAVLAATIAAGFAVDTEFTVEPLHESAGDGLMEHPRGSTMKTRLKALRVAAVSAAAVVSFAVTESAQAQQPVAAQWRVEDGGNGHWYRVVAIPQGIAWTDARDAATSMGGHLATIQSASEDSFVIATCRAIQWVGRWGPWLGGNQSSGAAEPGAGWLWVTGEPLNYTSWNTNEPNNGPCPGPEESIAYLNTPDARWNDLPNSGFCQSDGPVGSYAVEWDADCNSDGIVDYGQCRDGSLPDFDADNVPDCCERNEPCTVGYYPRQWRVEDGGNGHWYELVISGPLTWGAARDRAEMRGGHLATPTSPAENAFIIPLANHPEAWVEDCCGNTGGPWLGGYQPIGASPQDPWRWVTGEPWDWAGWAPGEPNNGFQPGILVTAMLGYPPLNQNFRGWADGFADGTSPDYPIQFPLDVSFIAEYSADCNNDGIVDYGQILLGELTDLDANGIPDTCEVVSCNDADLTQNGTVDGADLGAILAFWGPTGQVLPQADINRDGQVNGADIGLLLSFWGPCGG
jgi:hypothetical protein